MGDFSRKFQQDLEKNISRPGFVLTREASDEIHAQPDSRYIDFARRVLVEFCGIKEDRWENTFKTDPRAIDEFRRCLTHASFDPKKDWQIYSALGSSTLENAFVQWFCSATNILTVPRSDFFLTEIIQYVRDQDSFSKMAKFLGVDKMIRWQAIRIKLADKVYPLAMGELMIEDGLKSLCFWIQRFLFTTFGRGAAAISISNAAVQNMISICANAVMPELTKSGIDAKFLKTIKHPVSKVKEILHDNLRLPTPQYVNAQTDDGFIVSLTVPSVGRCPSKTFSSPTVARPAEGQLLVAVEAEKWLGSCGYHYQPSLIPIDLRSLRQRPLYKPQMDEEISHLALYANLLVLAGVEKGAALDAILKNRDFVALEIKRALTHETTLESVESEIVGSFNYQGYEFVGDKIANEALAIYLYNRFRLNEDPDAAKKLDLVKSRMQGKGFISQNLYWQLGITSKDKKSALIRWQPLVVNDIKSGMWQWALEGNANGTNMIEDTWESIFGAVAAISDKIFAKGVGFGLCYNIMAAVLDPLYISSSLEENATYTTKFKEWFDKIRDSKRPKWDPANLTIEFGFIRDPKHANVRTSYSASYNRSSKEVDVKVFAPKATNFTLKAGPIMNEVSSRWYYRLGGAGLDTTNPETLREVLSGTLYKWIVGVFRWNAEKSELELIGG